MKSSPWLCLEAIPGLVALEADWQRMVGEQFAGFKSLCLKPSSWRVPRFPCPRRCGCNHSVIMRHDGNGAVAVCRCAPPACPDIPLTLQQITPMEVSYVRLGHAICNAFGFTARYAELPPPNTFQFGSWSTDAVPAILTIQVQNSDFRRAVAELAAHLRQPFMLFGPTSDFLDAPAKSMLENCGAAFFDLNTQVILTGHGTLQPTGVPGELFARFNPQPKELDLEVARRVFALVRNLDTDKPLRPPTLLAVFRHYCIEELSASKIARKYGCSKPTILRRLELIRARTGMDPRQLRRLSPHITKLEDSLRDPRARRLRPQSALDQDPED
jgi:hypothetical protein